MLKELLEKKVNSIIDANELTDMQVWGCWCGIGFVCALIVYSRQQPQALADFFDSLIPDIKDTFPLSRWEGILKSGAQDLKAAIEAYYEGIDSI